MKKSLLTLSLFCSFSVLAAPPQISNLSKDDVEDITTEFGGNFAHTAVAAPETDGAWGVEVGVVGGTTKSPNFSDVITASGGDGGDLEKIYHAGLMARVHLPGELFIEATMLPEQEISDVKISSNSFAVGWNVGRFVGLPLDVALGMDYGKGELSFHQDADVANSVPESDISLETKTTVYWIGVSKSFWFITPYLKVGTSQIKGDLDATADIFGYAAATSESVDLSGSFLAAGANIQLAFIKFGIEGSQIQDARRISGKFSLDF